MPDKIPNNGELFDAASTAESESVQWVTLHLQHTVRNMRSEQPEEALEALFIKRFQQHQRRRRWLRTGMAGSAGLGGLGLGAEALFDIEWLELINSLFGWIGRPLIVQLVKVFAEISSWVA